MNLHTTTLGIIVTLLLGSCEEPPNVNCPPDLESSALPYSSPIWHPSGDFLGFNYWPVDSIIDYGPPCYGSRIIFEHDSTLGFWLVNADGTGKRRVLPYMISGPEWSSDGKWLVFPSLSGLVKMPFNGEALDTTSSVQLTEHLSSFYYEPTLSPDGDWIAYHLVESDTTGLSGIWIIRTDGSEKRFLFEGSNPAWHPDGKSIIGVSRSNELSSDLIFVRHYPFEPTLPETLSSVGVSQGRFPRFSPDRQMIAFWSNVGGMGDIWLMDADGSNSRQTFAKVADDVNILIPLPFSWHPNSREIVYVRYKSGEWNDINGTIWNLDTVTGEKVQLTFIPANASHTN